MNKKQTYNKGVESGLKVAQKVIEQETEAMEYLQSRIDLIVNGHEEMKSAVNRLIQDADETAIINIFGVCNDVRPCDLKEHEKMILLNILATLSSAYLNENQKRYYNNLRHHINLQGFSPDQNYDFRYIEKIESVKAIKVIAKAVRIFLYLKDNSMNGVYMHEDDLFSHFELRSFDEIDAMIESLACLFGEEGLIEFYGDFKDSDESEKNLPCYINVEEKEHISISNECAQIYFKDCDVYDDNLRYIESASYIIYSCGDKIMGLHKRTCVKNIMLDNIKNAAELFKKKQITAYSDMAYFVLGNDLFFLDLDNEKTGFIFHIEELKKEPELKRYIADGGYNNIDIIAELKDGKEIICDITELGLYQSQKLVYRNGYHFYITDLQMGISSTHQLDINPVFCSKLTINSLKENKSLDVIPNSYFIRGDYIYFIDGKLNDDKYILKRYNILNNCITNISKTFGKRDFSYSYNLISQGIYKDNFYCVFSYTEITSFHNWGFKCFHININLDDITEAEEFYIWHSCVYQFEQYENNLVYVNADKSYSLTAHNFINNKKNVLRKNYGQTKTSTFSDRHLLHVSSFQRPNRYMRLGKWLWIKEPGKWTPEIISICD